MTAEPALVEALRPSAHERVPPVEVRPCVDLAFARDATGRSYLGRQYVGYPVHVGRALHVDGSAPDLCVVYLQSVSGGLFEHERLASRIEMGQSARAHIATPASTIVHAMQGGSAVQRTRLVVQPGALLEYMPAPLILFPGSHMVSDVDVTLAEGALVVVTDSFLPHDPAGGQRSFARLESTMTVRDGNGQLLARERMCIDGENWLSDNAGANAGLRIHGSLWLLGGSADAELLQTLRALPELDGALAGASQLPNATGIVFRTLAADAVRLERIMHAAWVAARTHHTGSAPALRRR
ncbi:urease accessory protein UreD [Methyloversatilis discipulorum]|uniref:urease accessory protein UreD n=1 Tax=Methyloversatilis discipulorum TaxID=1119528 RepID=UPI001A548085|nr:urease accessory protein UreD [Methyloversatilis discipulorum]MBL8468514.1 urease accessory protein UreD [Methyloversatilis discipulorum]